MRLPFICTIFFFAVWDFIHHTPLPRSLDQGIPVFLITETEAPNVIFKIYKVPMRCHTEITVCARPFCNFPEVSNNKVRSDCINNTMRGKTTLGNSLLSSMGPGLSLEVINQKKSHSVSHSNVKAFIYSVLPLLLYNYYRPYHHTVTVVHYFLQNKGIHF